MAAWAGLVLAGLLSAGGARPEAPVRPGGNTELRIGLNSKPGPFDFAVAPSPEQTVVVRSAYETLVKRETDPATGETHFRPGVAANWEQSEGGSVWTFRIEPGHRFDDGTEVTSAAVQYTLDRLMRLGRGPASLYLEYLSAVEDPDPYTLRIRLKQPNPLLLHLVADRAASIVNPAIASHAVDGDEATRWLATRSAGSGPYRLLPSNTEGSYVLVPNPHARHPPVYFKRIVFRVLPDPMVRQLSLLKGELDVALLLPAQWARRLENQPGVRVETGRVLAFQNIAFNMESRALADRRIRLAIARAIDCESIIKYIKGGRASPFFGPIPRGMPGARAAPPRELRHDPAEAAALARAAGVQRGTLLRMIYPGVSPETDSLAQYLQAVLVPLGFNVRLERLSIPGYLDRMQRGTYDLVLMGFVAEFNDPMAIMNFWFDPAKAGINNPARYSNPVVADLLARSAVEVDAVRREQLLAEAVRHIDYDLPYAYLMQVHVPVALRADLQGFRFDPVDTLALPLATMSRR